MVFGILLPKEADLETFRIGDEDESALTYKDSGYPVVWRRIEMPPRTTLTVSVTYTVPGPPIDNAGSVFSLTLVPQTGADFDRYSVHLSASSGFRLTQLGAQNGLRLEGALDRPAVAAARVAPE
jgi:hypothetical protein